MRVQIPPSAQQPAQDAGFFRTGSVVVRFPSQGSNPSFGINIRAGVEFFSVQVQGVVRFLHLEGSIASFGKKIAQYAVFLFGCSFEDQTGWYNQ